MDRQITYAKCLCGHRACTSYTLSNQGSVGFSLKDARLLAAAPELLAALRAMVASVDVLPYGSKEQTRSVMEAADAAIVKAEGAS